MSHGNSLLENPPLAEINSCYMNKRISSKVIRTHSYLFHVRRIGRSLPRNLHPWVSAPSLNRSHDTEAEAEVFLLRMKAIVIQLICFIVFMMIFLPHANYNLTITFGRFSGDFPQGSWIQWAFTRPLEQSSSTIQALWSGVGVGGRKGMVLYKWPASVLAAAPFA